VAQVHPVYAAMDTTIFEQMSGLARELGAINLGQGFPDEPPPPELIAAAARALAEKSNQYPPGPGLPELRDAVAAFYARRQDLRYTRKEVIVTSGATEAIAAAILALVRSGDEVVLFQPAYDAYAPMVRRAGGVPVSVPLSPPDWRYDAASLEAAMTERTGMLIFNDPHNPAGTVASEAELAAIADLCIRRNLLAICDEVWEDVRFDGLAHRSLTSLPGMEGRGVKIGSAGKIFGLTGWKIGWICAAPAIGAALTRAHQFLTYTSPPALQWAVAEGLALPDEWFAARLDRWTSSRARLKCGLEQAGYVVLPSAATWFLCVDLSASGLAIDDRRFAERAVREAGVATIPVSELV
jgi:N-succinyldiaminopimelate aminotransferase